ncbi:glycosyl transferase, group 1 [Fulvivirga imtechensis AK7]|uniref:Glycosyl transferase, group 1 n=1 Tax=Fulvivirga imtechensis AK7 TaxID=1237149 RepID=L8JSP1_9BACT|nr:glycosyltransferase [Fulvivirga imtechensis]ELR70377.1 glycosyl transferase, group 1 [Fulvivirga imtechensis AK7]
MNIFIIPSWYPSESNPLNGIFVKEQTLLMAQHYPDINFGISRWGQNDESFLLHSQQVMRNIRKILNKQTAFDHLLLENVSEFFSPAYSWHQSITKGNIKGKIKACLNNLRHFEQKFGKADIIHAHVSYPAGYIAQQLSKITGIPYVITEHMAPFPQKYHLTKTGTLKPEILEAINKAHKVIAVSADLKKMMRQYCVYNRPLVIPNFIQIAPPIKKAPSKKIFRFIVLSGMIERKAIDQLLNAIDIATKSNKKIHFTLVGDGPLLNKLEQKGTDLNLDKYLTWTGFKPRSEITNLLLESNAHILVSHYDSFGVAYIEAMAMGLPSIAAAIGGPLDIIDENTGVLVKEVKPELIAEKILWMVDNYQQFEAKTIRKSFEERFSVEAVAPKIRSVYESLL